MNKTIKINLGGSLFQTDENAYRILRDYLQVLNNRFRHAEGGAETIEDIESRIAELLRSQTFAGGIITEEDVEKVLAILGSPEDFDIDPDNSESAGFPSQKKSLYRNPEDAILGGVCGGIGAYLNMDSVWIRVLFILFAIFFGIGLFVYLALWIAVPSARNEDQKREMYGEAFIFKSRNNRQSDNLRGSMVSEGRAHTGTTGAGGALNEIFKALGKLFFIILRIFLIFLGTALILTGFLTILTFALIFFLKYQGGFFVGDNELNLFYLSDFLNHVVNPAVTPWIIALSFIAVSLPMIAFIYWGVKMIFWFRAKDGLISLIGFLLWALSLAALSVILLNEGVSFAEKGKITSVEVLIQKPAEIYIMAGKRISNLDAQKKFSLPDEEYEIYFSGDSKDIYIRTSLNVHNSGDDLTRLEVTKRSSGRSKSDAKNKAETLVYEYSFNGDTLWLDEYFTIPEGSRWTCDMVEINLTIPEGTRLNIDRSATDLFDPLYHSDEWYFRDNKSSLWVMTEKGLSKNP